MPVKKRHRAHLHQNRILVNFLENELFRFQVKKIAVKRIAQAPIQTH
jgi:hypothetical protein